MILFIKKCCTYRVKGHNGSVFCSIALQYLLLQKAIRISWRGEYIDVSPNVNEGRKYKLLYKGSI